MWDRNGAAGYILGYWLPWLQEDGHAEFGMDVDGLQLGTKMIMKSEDVGVGVWAGRSGR